jgi:hypothetical protein
VKRANAFLRHGVHICAEIEKDARDVFMAEKAGLVEGLKALRLRVAGVHVGSSPEEHPDASGVAGLR